MTTDPGQPLTPLADALAAALDADDTAALDALADTAPADERDRYATLLTIYALHTAPVERVGAAARHQHRPAVAALKQRCEQDWLAELDTLELPTGPARSLREEGAVEALRSLAAHDRLPEVYRWLARSADRDHVVTFLTLEGGPDAGFDDLVASCQIGLSGSAKMELATNYWDEMGNGHPGQVHTTLHETMAEALGMDAVPVTAQPTTALARTAFGGLLATNRWLQPEALGALGLIELQAGPRCRLVLQAFERCGVPAAAFPFYEVHADVDPRHGQDWLDKAIAPTVQARPDWGGRIVRGALWRSAVNAAFLDELTELLVDTDDADDEPVTDVAA